MSDQTPPPRSNPLVPPPQPGPPPLHYAGPASQAPPPQPSGGTAQKVFDTVAGPNLRLRDNMIQLVSVLVGGSLGAAVGWFLTRDSGDGTVAILAGVVAGVVGSLLISGVVIGAVRGIGAARR